MNAKTKKIEILYKHDKEVRDWMARQLPGQAVDEIEKYTALGVTSDGEIIAAFLFYNYFKAYGTMELGMATTSPMWANKETMAGLFGYPFYQLGVNKLWAAIAADNVKAIKTAEHAGFKRETELEDHYGPNKPAVLLRILRREFIGSPGKGETFSQNVH
ncbi:MAG: GNAT family N-acetyltransferase [Nitrospinae bacterium]|nr:GNAT family N-acetyltransferase [Nitrospinota bacterium]